jgi:hypothetical protein
MKYVVKANCDGTVLDIAKHYDKDAANFIRDACRRVVSLANFAQYTNHGDVFARIKAAEHITIYVEEEA